jgi:hypothetical protein
MVTQEQLHDLFEYREDGNLIRRVAVRGPGGQIGRAIGSMSNGGKGRPEKKYMTTKIAGQHYYVHKLIYLYHHGYAPEQVDHINRNALDNRIENMRAATNSQNCSNRRLFKNNTSGFRGVSWDKIHKKWASYVSFGGKRKTLGFYDDLHEAAKRSESARNEFHGDYAAQY